MLRPIRVGDRIPPAFLGALEDGALRTVATEPLFLGRRAIVLGVPGAFTPTCTLQHVPDFVANAERLREAGFSLIACLAPNDPWVLRDWASRVDPHGRILFLSDGNLDLSRRMGLTDVDRENYLGERCRRFLMVLRDAVVEKLNVEKGTLAVSCTGVRDALAS